MIKTKEKSRHPQENDGVGLTWKTAYPWKSSINLNCYPGADGYYMLVSCGLMLSLVQIYFAFFLFSSLMATSI